MQNLEKKLEAAQAEAEDGGIVHLRRVVASQGRIIIDLEAKLKLSGPLQKNDANLEALLRSRLVSQEQQIAHLAAVAQNGLASSDVNVRNRIASQEQQIAQLAAALAAAEEAAMEWQAMHREIKCAVLEKQSKERDLDMQLKRNEAWLNKSHAAAKKQEAHAAELANELEILKRSNTELQTESAAARLLKQELDERKAAWEAAQAGADLGLCLSEAAWEAAQSEAADLKQSLAQAKQSEIEIKESLAERELQLQEALSAASELTEELEVMQGAWADAKAEVGTLKQSLATEGERSPHIMMGKVL